MNRNFKFNSPPKTLSPFLRRFQGAILVFLLGLTGWGCDGCNGPPEKFDVEVNTAKNIILISLDALRADNLNCYGFEKFRNISPAIDGLAKEGVLFERFIAAAPWTTPGHMSMLTGLHPSTHGVMFAFTEIWEDVTKRTPVHGLHNSQTTLAEMMTQAGFVTAAFTGGGTMDPILGFDQGFSRYEIDTFKMNDENMSAIEGWIEMNREERFFLFWHTFETHAPYNNPELVTKAVGGEKGEILRKELLAIAENMPKKNLWPHGPSRQRGLQKEVLKKHSAYNPTVVRSLYAGGVKSADKWIGRLVEKLKALSLYDDTVIIVTSDHGEELGDHSKKRFYNKHGHSLYEEMVHIPLVMKLIGKTPHPVRIENVVRTVDLVPTILDFAGIKKHPEALQGESLVPMISKPYTQTHRVAYIEGTTGSREQKAITDKNNKYIIQIPKETVKHRGRSFIPLILDNTKLFNLVADPKEKDNLLVEPDGETQKAAKSYDDKLRTHISGQESLNTEVELDQETIDRLIGLGYIGD